MKNTTVEQPSQQEVRMLAGSGGKRIMAAMAVVLGGVSLGGVAGAAKSIKSREYETERGNLKIALYEKWSAGDEKSWKDNNKVILLVHGATWSSRCTFDPIENYSLMDSLAAQGYDVWALDLHGYGKSGHTTRDWTDTASAAQDIDAAADYIRALRWVDQIHILGYQWGSQPAGMFAVEHPKKVGKLVLFGMHYQQIERKGQPDQQYRNNGSAMMHPEDGDLDPEFVRRRAQVCQQLDAKSPNGALVDMTQASPVDPQKLKMPVLLISGEKEADDVAFNDRLDFFKSLAAHSKWFTVLQGLGKYATFEKNRGRFEAALLSFLDQP